jgi:hypothetical protein
MKKRKPMQNPQTLAGICELLAWADAMATEAIERARRSERAATAALQLELLAECGFVRSPGEAERGSRLAQDQDQGFGCRNRPA